MLPFAHTLRQSAGVVCSARSRLRSSRRSSIAARKASGDLLSASRRRSPVVQRVLVRNPSASCGANSWKAAITLRYAG